MIKLQLKKNMTAIFKNSIFLYAVSLALLLICLRFIEYEYFMQDHAVDTYLALIALLFTGVGIWAGIKLTSGKKLVVEKKIPVVIQSEEFHPEKFADKMKDFNISMREYEVLHLISTGLTNQQIADKLFLSLSSVKTYTARLFNKLDVERRTQAVQKAKAIGLIP